MKKIFAIFLVALVALFAVSCGTTKNVTKVDGNYTAVGVGESTDYNVAWEQAYSNALNAVNQKHSIKLDNSSVREYDSHSGTKGAMKENVRYGGVYTTKSEIKAYDVEVLKEKHKTDKNGRYVVTLTVRVQKEDVE